MPATPRLLLAAAATSLTLLTLSPARAAQPFSPVNANNLTLDSTAAANALASYLDEADSATPPPSPDMKEVTVYGERSGELNEEKPVGPYGQPEWTTHRRFTNTRVYVLPPWTVQVEYWFIMKDRRDDGRTDFIHMAEVEIGLPYRFQIDLYAVANDPDDDGDTTFDGQFEVRWALADWGKIWGNPTLYLEYIVREDNPDKFEAKILFGGNIAPRWHWGVNFVWEYELSGEQESELELTAGVSYTIIDGKLSIGPELKASIADVKGNRGDYEENIRIGPSIQWRPVEKMHIDVAPLFGVTNSSRFMDFYFIIGWEF